MREREACRCELAGADGGGTFEALNLTSSYGVHAYYKQAEPEP